MRLLAFDRETYAKSYDVVSNATLWFVHHHLFDLARRPRFDARWQDAWEAYRMVNARFTYRPLRPDSGCVRTTG